MPAAIKRMGADELLELLTWEFRRLPLIHNAPLEDAAKINDDTKMMTTLTNGYLQNVAQRYLLGVESQKNLINEGRIMVDYLGCTPFAVEDQPTLREANSRIFYLANNLGKTDAGNFAYGEVTYVINPAYADKMYVVPWDSGAMCARFGPAGSTPTGTLDDFYHLVEPHFQILAPTATGGASYNMSSWLRRWYGGGAPFSYLTFPYFEVEMAANCWLPDGLLYIIPLYHKMWGNNYGEWLQAWATANRLPLVWADGDDSGMILDPMVNQLSSPQVTSAMTAKFASLWKTTGRSFKEVYDAVDPALRFELPSYLKRDICAPFESGNNVMGTTAKGECAYWTPLPVSLTYECLNDGTCATGVGGGHGKFYDKDTCDANCGGSRWQCMQHANQKGCAGEHARTCISDPAGSCVSLKECESSCYE